MQTAYLALLLAAGIAFFLQIQWLFFALLILFVAVMGAQYYTQPAQAVSMGEAAPNPHAPAGPQQVGMAPPFVVTNRDTPEDIRHQMISTMMGQIMAADMLAARSTPGPFDGFTLRQYKWRQGPEPGTKAYYEETFRNPPEEKWLKKNFATQAAIYDELKELRKSLKKKDGH